ncbi:MAG: ABC transporter ATP-binding protein [Deltaproteobacteria bacterium]|nr:ABC transporter ATP-binding protein [Deltaproteobacteria bacterium]
MSGFFARQTLEKIYRFFGPATVSYIVIGAFVGVILFVIEAAFAYALQSFLIAIGVLSPAASALPKWVPVEGFYPVLAFVCVVGVLRGVFQWVQAYYLEAAAEMQRCEQRRRVVDYVFKSRSVNTGEMLSLFNEHANAAATVASQLQTVATRGTSALLMFAWMAWKAPVPSLIFVAGLGVAGVCSRSIDRRNGRVGHALLADHQAITTRIATNIRNLLLMQIYGTQEREAAVVQARLASYRDNALSYANYAGLAFAIPQIFGIFLVCGVILVVRHTGSIVPGDLISYFYLIVRFVQTVADFVRNAVGVQFYAPRVGHLAKWWADHASDGVRGRQLYGKPPSSGEKLASPVGWRLSGVGFRYETSGAPIFERLDAEIPMGKTTVITGPSGSGKSTLINIMLGNYEPQTGSIALTYQQAGETRSRPLSELRHELYEVIGYVSSEAFIVDGSIRENLCYGLTGKPTDAELEGALRKAECGFVFELPGRLEHRLTEQGQGLSAGQKQRLSLARALLRKPKVLLLDEATSNLDYETEAKLLQTLRELKEAMTIVAITHRPTFLYNADHKIEFHS